MSSIEEIKSRLDNHIGEAVTVVSQAGRKKFTERSGVLRSTFPSLFVVELDEDTQFKQASYSYAEILTKNVQVDFAE
ncbi:Veg family protein [Fructobacillus fructosus]|uniref:Veg family protein n=1 Tax=Fructobacillus fructosus TaxID=1631 RepID=UPI001658A8C4|nr:Veg family protein [Fructobacillus fructosus]MBC9118511.1 Veg family protein [Fructobacillus fructosus]MBD9364988.1 Veg family protein [Leuconostoc mesenteroides]